MQTKGVGVEAIKFDGDTTADCVEFIIRFGGNRIREVCYSRDATQIEVLLKDWGRLRISAGDWITNSAGPLILSYSSDDFAALHEEIGDA